MDKVVHGRKRWNEGWCFQEQFPTVDSIQGLDSFFSADFSKAMEFAELLVNLIMN